MRHFFKNKYGSYSICLLPIVAVTAACVLIGWQLNIELLKRVLPFFVAMNPLTALLFILTSISFLLTISTSTYQKVISTILLFLIIAVCLIVISDRYLESNLKIDEILFSEKVSEDLSKGLVSNMAPNSAILFIFSASALLLLNYKNTHLFVPYQILTIIGFCIAFFSLLGYLYGAPEFYTILKHFPMALHTSICFILIFLSILFFKPNVGIVKEFTGNLAGSTIGPILLLSAFVVPFLLGLIRLYTHREKLFSTELGITLLVLSIIVIFCSLVLWNVVLLNKKDLLRKANEDKFKSLVESAPDAIVIVDDRRIIQLVNIETEMMFGYDRIQIIGKPIELLITKLSFDSTRNDDVFLSIENSSASTKEYIASKKGGELFPVEIRISPLETGAKILTSISIRDISARKLLEETNWNNQEIFRTLVSNVVDYAIFMLDVEGNILTWNRGAEFIKGYKRTEIIGKHISIFYLEEDKHLAEEMLMNAKVNGKSECEGWRVRKDGSVFWADVIFNVLYDRNGFISGFAKITRDSTDKKKMQDTLSNFNKELKRLVKEKTSEIAETTQQLRYLSAHLQTAREEERKYIAREMHDELGQMITGLRMDVVWLRKKIASNDETIISRFERTLDLLNDVKQSMRRIAMDLHPAVLNDLGLITALKVYAQEFENRSGIKVRFDSELFGEDESKLTPEISIGLYRIFQESLNNVVKHAEANEVRALLKRDDIHLEFQIQDDGKGFYMEDISHKKSLGLISIRERMYMIDGKYEIISAPGKGTKIVLSVPLV